MATNEGEVTMVDKTIRELQTTLPWTIRYSRDFRANPQSHKDFAHAMVHAAKAVGKLMALVDDMDHDRDVADAPALREQNAKYLADLVVCALRAANTFPGGVVDLQAATENRITTKNAPAVKENVIDGDAADRSVELATKQEGPAFNVNAFTGQLERNEDGVCFLAHRDRATSPGPSFPRDWFSWLQVGSEVELIIETPQLGAADRRWKGCLRRADATLGGVALGQAGGGVITASIDWFYGIADGLSVKVTTRPAQ